MRQIHLELEILYREDDGSSSRRRLTVKRFGVESDGSEVLLAAHCSRTRAFGEFHSSRIVQCLDALSGEAVDDLPAWISARYACSRQGRLETLQAELRSELAVLLTLGHADRLLQRREQELIAAYLHPRQPRRAGAEPLTPVEIASHLRWIPQPTSEDFEAAVEALAAADRAERQRLFSICLAVADVREAREGGEQPAIDRLQQRWFDSDGNASASDHLLG